jgi:bla regulator protein blaR1
MNPLHWLSRPELAALALALVHFLWQGTLIALFLAAVVRLWRIERATQRYACSLAALLAMALCPVITYLAIGPQWDPPVVAATHQEPTGSDQSQLTSESSASGYVSWWQAATMLSRGIQPYLLALWLVGVVALGLRLIGGLIGVVRLHWHKLPLPLDLAGRVEQLGKALRIDALPSVFLSRTVSEALVIGFWRPVVLVPAAWAAEMPLVVLEAVIAHELAHIRRLDLWVNLLQRVVETLLFYHPAVWWVSRQLRLEREMCCDELAVAATGRRIAYVKTLELVARERLAGVRPALSAGIRGGSNMKLLARVRNVLGGPAGESFGLWPAGLLALLLPLVLWTVTFGVLSPSPAAAVAADDDDNDDGDDDDDSRADNDRDDDDDEQGDRKAGNREREGDDDEAGDKKEVLRKFLEGRKEARKEGDEGEVRKEGDRKDGDPPKKERKEGDAPKKERKEGDAPKKERKEGDAPKKERKEGDAPKKERKEGEQPKKIIKEGADERKEPINKKPLRKEGEAPVKKPAMKEGGDKRGEVAELASMIKELRGEVDRLRAEVRELRGGKPGGDEWARIKGEASQREAIAKKLHQAKEADSADAREAKEKEAVKQKLLEAVREKERAADREAAEHKERAAKEREAVEQKLREVAREKERAAAREAAERKERISKELEAAARKEALRKEADKKDREPDKQ